MMYSASTVEMLLCNVCPIKSADCADQSSSHTRMQKQKESTWMGDRVSDFELAKGEKLLRYATMQKSSHSGFNSERGDVSNLARIYSWPSGIPSFFGDYFLLRQLFEYAVPPSEGHLAVSALLLKFRTLGAVFAASESQLLSVSHVTEEMIHLLRIVQSTMLRLADPCTYHRKPLKSWEMLITWLRLRLGHEPNEIFLVLFLDNQNNLITEEEMSRGTVNEAPVYTREVIKRALELSASCLILVHNHPAGGTQFSRQDIRITKAIIRAARTLSITVHDHVIVSSRGYSSFREKGLIEGDQ